jgi:hypothetical protein
MNMTFSNQRYFYIGKKVISLKKRTDGFLIKKRGEYQLKKSYLIMAFCLMGMPRSACPGFFSGQRTKNITAKQVCSSVFG